MPLLQGQQQDKYILKKDEIQASRAKTSLPPTSGAAAPPA